MNPIHRRKQFFKNQKNDYLLLGSSFFPLSESSIKYFQGEFACYYVIFFMKKIKIGKMGKACPDL